MPAASGRASAGRTWRRHRVESAVIAAREGGTITPQETGAHAACRSAPRRPLLLPAPVSTNAASPRGPVLGRGLLWERRGGSVSVPSPG